MIVTLIIALWVIGYAMNAWPAQRPSAFTEGSEWIERENERAAQRIDMTLAVARLYRLTREQAILLLAIYDHEDGAPAKKEFGIEGKPPVTDPIHRLCRNACFAALTIKRRCPNTKPETIMRFNHGYSTRGKKRYPGYSEDPNWWVKVMQHMEKYKNLPY
jgi:hypothetical protein